MRIPANVLQRDFEYAVANTPSAIQAAKFLNISYPTFRRYAKIFRDKNGVLLWDLAKWQAGDAPIPRTKVGMDAKYLGYEYIFSNQHPNYPMGKLYERLIKDGLKEDTCEICGHFEKRLTDNKTPHTLVKIEGDSFDLSNLQVICYNCLFLNYDLAKFRK